MSGRSDGWPMKRSDLQRRTSIGTARYAVTVMTRHVLSRCFSFSFLSVSLSVYPV